MKIRCGHKDEDITALDAKKLQLLVKAQMDDLEAANVVAGVLGWFIRFLPKKEQNLTAAQRREYNQFAEKYRR